MKRLLQATAVATIALTGPAFAEVSTDTLKIYAAMAKLEANMAEAAGAVMLAAAARGDAEIIEEAREDYASDLAQIDAYIALLQSTDLNKAQSAAVTALVEQWGPIAAEGTTILEHDDGVITEAAFAWWQSLDGLDDVVDDQLEAILEAADAEILE